MNLNQENPDHLQRAWRGQPPMSIDAEPLLKELQRKERSFSTMIFWRDFREIGLALVLAPLMIHLGVKGSQPWTYDLTPPVLLWIAGYMLVDRARHRRRPPEPGEPLRRHLESSLAGVEHQIRLLRGVHRWALLPLAVAMLAFFGQAAWRERGGGWWAVLAVSMATIPLMALFVGVYWLNLYAVRTVLEPRRRELSALLMTLKDEKPGADE